ncbi:J domain-containing protein [Nodularia harveyana UHCC-0300]|uniref:J domain-containing protein n=1 Tax=Nodularia harveyana UHCC-0300 TaxID=2974287 RepID=A0ABU5UCB4_9CYAN|nr:J domain-containing protein [Nodularia harveyana]MEA5581170.1 J domain-containing protein [Nodularia harveyana UHCC-0300]
MPRKSTSSSQSPTTTSLALSSIHIRLETLDKEHQWLLKQIKRKRTELNNFVEQMRSVATDIFNRCHPKFENLIDIDREIHTLFDEIFSHRKLGKQTRKDITAIYYQLQLARIITPKPKHDPEDEDIDLNEIFGNDTQEDNFSDTHTEENYQYRAAPQETDFSVDKKSDAARKIRQTFLSLAEIFHPDKVKDSETQKHHTEIMKEINKAYQDGDLARLLEIEQQHQIGNYINLDSVDDLTRQCMSVEQQNQILKNQYETLKQELRQVKNTPEGAMVSDCRKATKLGIDPIGTMAEQVEAEINTIKAIRDFVKDFREQKITIKEFLSGPVNLRYTDEDSEDDMFEELFLELGELMFF